MSALHIWTTGFPVTPAQRFVHTTTFFQEGSRACTWVHLKIGLLSLSCLTDLLAMINPSQPTDSLHATAEPAITPQRTITLTVLQPLIQTKVNRIYGCAYWRNAILTRLADIFLLLTVTSSWLIKLIAVPVVRRRLTITGFTETHS